MKVEAVCSNDGCASNSNGTYVHLLSCAKLLPSGKTAVDEDGMPVACPFCNGSVRIQRLSRDEAQFALGKLDYTYDAVQLLKEHTVDKQDPLAWSQLGADLLARHLAGHGDVISGRAVSVFVLGQVPVWITTNENRTQTCITLTQPEVE